MLAEERYEEILKMVELKGAVTASEITKEIGASEATIRRDISTLAKAGKLNKVFGGATKISGQFLSTENDMRTKLGMKTKEKDAIAKYCASLISDDDFVYIDAGSSTLMMLDYLRNSKATFVTTGLAQAKKLMLLDLKTFVVGGYLKKQTDAIIGSETMEALSKYNFTKAFMGCNGVTLKQGFTTPDPEEGATKSKAISKAEEVYFLADSTKFEKICASKIAGVEQATIVTNEIFDEAYKTYAKVKEVTV
ncbi:MAG: DeoR/GlpR family DNA-binding transcription regulator [Bacillota bacterium]